MSSTYDRLSPYYDWFTISERPLRDRALSLLAVGAGETAVEIGCGTGRSLREMARLAGPDGRVFGLDRSPGMISQANQNTGDYPGAPITLLLGDGLRIPLAAGSCHAAFLSFTLELFELADQHRLLSEVQRVLAAGSRLAVVTLSTHAQTAVSAAYWSLHELWPAVFDCRPIAAAPLLNTAGFQITHQEQHSLFGLPIAILLAQK